MLRLPPPIWTMIFLALTAGAGWAIGWPAIPWPPHRDLVGMAIFFAGGVPPLWAYLVFRSENNNIDPLAETNSGVITSGPYAFSRNPMYLGLLIIAFGAALWVGAWPMLAAPPAVFLVANFVHIPFEEAKLRRQFGGAFDAYASRVRRWV
ncbi:MAG TPA: isoprenylcysteine carboxylmethyltransferase family protein [Caulobacteraceae bacterium]|jgi:protein-S-isoprenylcysteine O-methyltransferase Ste14|nr:isoprenylcysteine carboxylmethyltransferase family protein [Caulobacteraceae bacterium]